MATRVNLPAFRLPDVRGAASWRPVGPNDRRALAWHVVTALWWIWSDLPRLPLPSRNPALPAGGPAGDWVVHGLDRIATRIWIQRMMAIVARGIWLTILVGCLWLALELLGGPALNARIWLGIGVVLLLCSLIIAALSRPSRAQVARMLDRSFTLQERISTALGNIGTEIPTQGEQASVIYLQVADAANALTAAQEQPAFRLRPPIRELVIGIALALAFAALAFARGAGGSVPPVQTNVVPEFVPAAQRFVQPEAQPAPPDPQNVPSVAEVQQMVQTSIDNQQDLQALADALSDHALTREAAEQIQQGNYNQAAEELRDVASQADQLSQSERDDLAGDLNQAASQMSEGNQTLSDATQQAADGLKQGGDQAKDGVRNLANAVEQSGQQVQSSEALDQAMQQAQQNEAANGSQGQPPSQSQNGGQGDPSTSQQGDDGGQQSASSSSGQQSSQPGDAQANTGADAESGIGTDPASSSGQPGEGAPAEGDDSGAPGQQTGAGEGQQAQEGASEAGQSSQPSNAEQTGNEGSPNKGAGAGGESGDQNAQGAEESKSGGKTANTSPSKDPSDASVSDASHTGSDTSGADQEDREAIQLSRAPEGESVQIGGSSGASSLGTGSGVTVSNGTTQQGDVGQTGPDSNHVPPEYRSIVESYFSDQDKDG